MNLWPWICLLSFIAGGVLHYLISRNQLKRYIRQFNEQQEKEVLELIQTFKEELIYVLNHEGIKPISATSQGLVDIIILGLNHYIEELKKHHASTDFKTLMIIRGLQDIRTQELMMLHNKMIELKRAINKMLETPIKVAETRSSKRT